MKAESANHTSLTSKIILIGLGLAILYWILESVAMVLVFQGDNLVDEIFSRDPHEIWSRSGMAVAIAFGVGVQLVRVKRKETEEALHESEQLHRITLGSMSDAVFITDSFGTFTFICPNVDVIFGYSFQEVQKFGQISKLLGNNLFTPDELEVRKEIRNIEHEVTDKAGRRHVLLVTVKGVSISAGTVLYTCRDVTERKQAEVQLLTYQEQLRSLASQLSLAEERTRRNIAMQIHDHLGQNLAFCSIQLGQLMKSASSVGLTKALGEIRSLVEGLIEETQSLTFDLSPPLLYEVGLEAAVEQLTEQIQERYGIQSTFEDDGQPRPLDDDVRILLFQSIRELLINVAKHAQARNVRVYLMRHVREMRVIVEDNGVGFDTAKTNSAWTAATGFGLFSIRERLSSVGGRFYIESEPGHGTRAILAMPLKDE